MSSDSEDDVDVLREAALASLLARRSTSQSAVAPINEPLTTDGEEVLPATDAATDRHSPQQTARVISTQPDEAAEASNVTRTTHPLCETPLNNAYSEPPLNRAHRQRSRGEYVESIKSTASQSSFPDVPTHSPSMGFHPPLLPQQTIHPPLLPQRTISNPYLQQQTIPSPLLQQQMLPNPSLLQQQMLPNPLLLQQQTLPNPRMTGLSVTTILRPLGPFAPHVRPLNPHPVTNQGFVLRHPIPFGPASLVLGAMRPLIVASPMLHLAPQMNRAIPIPRHVSPLLGRAHSVSFSFLPSFFLFVHDRIYKKGGCRMSVSRFLPF